jgi:hypothetical protein
VRPTLLPFALATVTLAGCGSAASPSTPSFAPGIYQLRVSTFSLQLGSPVCGALPATRTYLATLRFDDNGGGFSGRGVGDSAGDSVEITMHVTGDSIAGSISGAFLDHGIGVADGDRVTVSFPATNGVAAGFAGRFTPATEGGNGLFSGRPTVIVPGAPPTTAVCQPGELLWLLSK